MLVDIECGNEDCPDYKNNFRGLVTLEYKKGTCPTCGIETVEWYDSVSGMTTGQIEDIKAKIRYDMRIDAV